MPMVYAGAGMAGKSYFQACFPRRNVGQTCFHDLFNILSPTRHNALMSGFNARQREM